VGVLVLVGVGVFVFVGVNVGVWVLVFVGVGVGVGQGLDDTHDIQSENNPPNEFQNKVIDPTVIDIII
jgi:opacity protein-like surface antigen